MSFKQIVNLEKLKIKFKKLKFVKNLTLAQKEARRQFYDFILH